MIQTRSHREKRQRRSHSDSDEFSSDEARHHDRERKGPRLALDEALILVLHFKVFFNSQLANLKSPPKEEDHAKESDSPTTETHTDESGTGNDSETSESSKKSLIARMHHSFSSHG